jgi:hypothetical protein
MGNQIFEGQVGEFDVMVGLRLPAPFIPCLFFRHKQKMIVSQKNKENTCMTVIAMQRLVRGSGSAAPDNTVY